MKHLKTDETKQESRGLEVLNDTQLSLVRGGDQENVEVGDDEEG